MSFWKGLRNDFVWFLTGYVPRPKTPKVVVRPDYTHLYGPNKIVPEIFISQLVKTIAHAESIISQIKDKSNIDYARVLRTENPLYNGEPFYRFTSNGYTSVYTPDISFNYKLILDEVLSKRKGTSFSRNGLVVEFDIDNTTHDGVPSAESSGFVDESDIPPIDTWFYLTPSKLYCWIPNLFIEKMQAAIDVEILDSYRWVKDADPELQRQIETKLQ